MKWATLLLLGAGCFQPIGPDCASPGEEAHLAITVTDPGTCSVDPLSKPDCYAIWKHRQDQCASEVAIVCPGNASAAGLIVWNDDGTFSGEVNMVSPCQEHATAIVGNAGMPVQTLDSVRSVTLQ